MYNETLMSCPNALESRMVQTTAREAFFFDVERFRKICGIVLILITIGIHTQLRKFNIYIHDSV
jgi:hypothetical protein